jgi:hypothetical protein
LPEPRLGFSPPVTRPWLTAKPKASSVKLREGGRKGRMNREKKRI